jgi:hypothetical protein
MELVARPCFQDFVPELGYGAFTLVAAQLVQHGLCDIGHEVIHTVSRLNKRA